MAPPSAEALQNLRKLEDRNRDGGPGRPQKEVFIVWDIENARIPAGVAAEDVEK